MLFDNEGFIWFNSIRSIVLVRKFLGWLWRNLEVDWEFFIRVVDFRNWGKDCWSYLFLKDCLNWGFGEENFCWSVVIIYWIRSSDIIISYEYFVRVVKLRVGGLIIGMDVLVLCYDGWSGKGCGSDLLL